VSANNWRDCPKCIAKATMKRARLSQEAQDSYGKVTPALYQEMLLAVRECQHPENSMREDWQLGINTTGEFYVSYYANCDECGFKFSFKQERQLEIRV